MLLITSCGKNYVTKEVVIQKEVQQVVQEFEGAYFLENGSIIELITDSSGDVTIKRFGQQVLSENPQNGTIAEHPKIVGESIQVFNGQLAWSKNVKYNSGHDVEEDISGNNINGVKKTDYNIKFENKKLVLSITIWNNKSKNNINKVIAKRLIKEQ